MFESLKSELGLASVVAGGIDPGVEPRMDAPWIPALQVVAGWIMASAVVILVIALVVGVALWLFGKFSGNSRPQEVGLPYVLWTMLGAAIIGGASAIIAFASGFELF